MANYRTNQFSYSFAQPEHLYFTVSFGASGAPTIASNTGMGIASFTRSSTGTFVITLSHAYPGLMELNRTQISPSGAPAAPGMYISASQVSNSAAPTITLVLNSSGTATDPASGESALFHVTLQKSSLRY